MPGTPGTDDFQGKNLVTLISLMSREDIREKMTKLSCSPTTLRAMKELVSEYNDEQITALIEKSTEADWQVKPAFYKALFMTFLERCMTL